MSLSFPNEHQNTLERAKDAFTTQNYQACLQALHQLVPESLGETEQKMIVSCQLALGEYEAALTYMKKHPELLTTKEMYTNYLQALCMTYRFLDAWFVSCALDDVSLQQKVLEMENAYLQFHPEQKIKKERELLDLSQGKRQTKNWLAFLDGLTSQQAKALLPALLVYQTQTQAQLKSKAAELLVKLNETRHLDVTHPLTMKVHRVAFSELTTLEQSEQLQVLDQTSLILATQPQVLAATVTEIRAHWAYLYPFLPEVTQVKQWIDVYALDYKILETHPKETQTASAKNIQEIKEMIRLKFSLFS